MFFHAPIFGNSFGREAKTVATSGLLCSSISTVFNMVSRDGNSDPEGKACLTCLKYSSIHHQGTRPFREPDATVFSAERSTNGSGWLSNRFFPTTSIAAITAADIRTSNRTIKNVFGFQTGCAVESKKDSGKVKERHKIGIDNAEFPERTVCFWV